MVLAAREVNLKNNEKPRPARVSKDCLRDELFPRGFWNLFGNSFAHLMAWKGALQQASVLRLTVFVMNELNDFPECNHSLRKYV